MRFLYHHNPAPVPEMFGDRRPRKWSQQRRNNDFDCQLLLLLESLNGVLHDRQHSAIRDNCDIGLSARVSYEGWEVLARDVLIESPERTKILRVLYVRVQQFVFQKQDRKR